MYFKLVMPLVDGQTISRVVRKWHKAEGDHIDYGDDLLDVTCVLDMTKSFRGWAVDAREADDGRPSSGGHPGNRQGDSTMMVIARVTSSDIGVLRRIDMTQGACGEVGSVLAVLTSEDGAYSAPGDEDLARASEFRIVTSFVEISE